jgi:cysteine desulfurase / selenocysteine lyase
MYKKDFPIFHHNPELVYLDSASTTQKPNHVLERMASCMSHGYANIHRWSYELSEQAEEMYHASKSKIASFLWAKSGGEIHYFYNATAAFNYLEASIGFSNWVKKWDVILLSQLEHHANIVPWQILAKTLGVEVRFTPIKKDWRLDMEALRKELTPNVKVISLSWWSNVTGEILSLAKIRDIINTKYSASDKPLFIIDGSQRFPHIQTNVQELEIDFFIFTGHKVFSDTWIWVLYGKENLLRQLSPAWSGWWAINSVTENGYESAGLPFRHEPGTPHIIGAASLLGSLEYIESIGGYTSIEKHERVLIDYVFQKLYRSPSYLKGNITLINDLNSPERIWVFSFVFPNIHTLDMADYLADHHIAVRAGHHCTEPLHKALGIPASLRMSLSVYNSEKDIDQFFEALEEGISFLQS